MFAFRPDYMLEVLPVMGYGMLGIFLVTAVYRDWRHVKLLNRFSEIE